MKDIKIYFLGNKLGHSIHKLIPTNLTNKRRNEESSFHSVEGLKRTHFINKADILFFRNRGATTSDKAFKSLSKRVNDSKLIINDIRSFLNYDSKDRSFEIWKKNNLQCPNHISFSLNEMNESIHMEKMINQFLERYKKILIRTNNETGSNGLYVTQKKEEIPNIISTLKNRVNSLKLHRKDTKIMCVEYIQSKSTNNSNNLYRVHILFDQILSYYVTTSTRDEFHNADMTMDDLETFISENKKFQSILPNIKEDLIKAVKLLGSNIGAIEFFLVNGKPCFLELNPIWGGHASRNGFGDKAVMNYLKKNKQILLTEIPNIFKWLDYKTYYADMYSLIKKNYLENFNL